MILCLDVGNSQMFAGVFSGDERLFHFRRNTHSRGSSDEIGIFLRSVLRENEIDPSRIQAVAICSVVPDLTHSLRNACLKYFGVHPFLLEAGVKTGLKIRVKNPLEVGADRIANAIGASSRHAGENLIVIDLGTATTFDVVSQDKEYFGGAIMPGLGISMESLESRTAKLPTVEILRPSQALGRSTVEGIQSGLYYGHLGAMRELISRISQECFPEKPVRVLATGGFTRLYEESEIFDAVYPDLVLEGLLQARTMNLA